jgi:hypothetical protein
VVEHVIEEPPRHARDIEFVVVGEVGGH